MLKIWGRKNSINVQKVLWTCAELNLEFERIDAGGQFGVNNTPEYLAMNPNGRVPTISDDGFILWESHAIVRYLARIHGKGSLWPTDDKVNADADRWMEWYSTTLWPHLQPLFWNLVRTPPEKRNAKLIEDSRVKLIDYYKMVENALTGRSYLAGSAFTMCDIPMGVSLHRWFLLPIERPNYPKLKAYYDRLSERPGFKQHCGAPLS
ncbi:MAG: glutathione S-transferase family protein [Gammaproteobacteria bacterium]|nr:glutathione S-transferase family protein [Gammaproteobacteria bacterium]